jgi:hypothetical protein
MGTMTTAAALFSETPPALQKPVVYPLENQITLWENEVNFYHRVLTWCLLSCEEEDRAGLDALIGQLGVLRTCDLPALKEKLGFLQVQPSNNASRVGSETTELRDSFYYFDQNLHKLKLKIFQGFPRFGRVQIW